MPDQPPNSPQPAPPVNQPNPTMQQVPLPPQPTTPPQAPVPPRVGQAMQGTVSSGDRKGKIIKVAIAFIVITLLAIIGLILFQRFAPTGLSVTGSHKKVELTWWGLWEDSTLVQPIITEYQEAHPNITINYTQQSHKDYRERLDNALQKGDGPDIFRFHNTWLPMLSTHLSSVPAQSLSAADFTKSFYPVASQDLVSGSSILGLPIMYDGIALYINQDMFTQAGIAAPSTWNEFEKAAVTLTHEIDNQIQVSGAALGRTENVDHWPEIIAMMIYQNGGNPARPSSTLAKDAVVYFTSYASGKLPTCAPNMCKIWNQTLPNSTIAFAAGKTAMMFAPSWRAFEIATQNPALNFKVVPVPQLPKEKPSDPDITYATYWAEGVWKRSENQQAAWDFVTHLSSSDTQRKFFEIASRTRQFGEPYSRIDMATLLSDHQVLGAYIKDAPNAKSWYLAARTWDGPTGINTRINKYYEDAINGINSGTKADSALQTTEKGVIDVLSKYGITQSPSLQN